MCAGKKEGDTDKAMYDFWKNYIRQDCLGRRTMLRQTEILSDFDTNLLLKFPDKQTLDYYIISRIQTYIDDSIEVFTNDKLHTRPSRRVGNATYPRK